jgi:tRNA (guanine-N7-)-methyltransferase
MARLRKTGKMRRATEFDGSWRPLITCTDFFSINPNSVFRTEAPLEVEIGAGRGDFIIARAAAAPHRNFLAVELSLALVQLLESRAACAALSNLCVVRMDARPLVNLFLPCSCVSAYHIYFPDPWPKTRHAKHRLFTPSFVGNLHRTMSAGALLYVATDVRDYAESIFSMVAAHGFSPTAEVVAGLDATGFARRFSSEGRMVYARTFAK